MAHQSDYGEHPSGETLILAILNRIDEKLDALAERQELNEATITTLKYAVFGAGPIALGAIGAGLWYLIVMHMK